MKRFYRASLTVTLFSLAGCMGGGGWTQAGQTASTQLFPNGTDTSSMGDNGIALQNAFGAAQNAGLNQVTGVYGIGANGTLVDPTTQPGGDGTGGSSTAASTAPAPADSTTGANGETTPGGSTTQTATTMTNAQLENAVRTAINNLRDGGDPATAAQQLYAQLPAVYQQCTAQIHGPDFDVYPGDELEMVYNQNCNTSDGKAHYTVNGNWIAGTPAPYQKNFMLVGWNGTYALTIDPNTGVGTNNTMHTSAVNNVAMIFNADAAHDGSYGAYNLAGHFGVTCTNYQAQSYLTLQKKHNNTISKEAGCMNTIMSLMSPAMVRTLASTSDQAYNAIVTNLLNFQNGN